MIHRSAIRATVVLVGLSAATASFALSYALPVWAQVQGEGLCSQYATYTALGEAEGLQSVASAPGATLVDTADGELPGAQAEVDSLLGSSAWAGAPYSSTVAGNVGNANVNPNQVPVFAVSSYPSEQNAHNSTPLGNLQASSSRLSSASRVVSGGPSSGQATVGQITVSASASCAADGTLQGTAASTTNAFDIAGVFSIAAVTSHASATMTASGQATLNGSMTLAGVTVTGQAVDITDQGIVVPGSSSPVPANPLERALSSAGITVRYLTLSKDPQTGSVMAPGIEVTVIEHTNQGVGQGFVTATYVLGRAMAIAEKTGGGTAIQPSSPTFTTQATPPAAGASTVAGTEAPVTPIAGVPASSSPASSVPPTIPSPSLTATPSTIGSPKAEVNRSVPTASSYILNSPALSFYAVVATGGILLLITALIFGIFGLNLKWR